MKKIVATALIGLLTLASGAMAQEKATPQEVYEMVTKAASMLEQLGPEGLAAFNDPKGEFSWKDSYVFILNCQEGKIAAHPSPKIVGADASVIKDAKSGAPILTEACQALTAKGIWKIYYWHKKDSAELGRKVSFLIPVQGQPYQVGAGVYDDTLTIEDLNKISGQ
ncbi:cache, type 2 domain protein [Desulfarculus baarsii DSM 2075]|uniref:Cache, type 2 domain protein n=1 Tax=Desulfarculus baarsii (strain ATCC 33931 / DSM 2075 / LMG 7858 / VKM B-1802 / 2st14) TaxID=644282 RepID=E1QJ44_DESB2|nr:cache, type 2 domain protein [Desulfarculus baarsii DSM 2075]